jgi:ATP-dependent RNA helicase DeaD
MVPIGKIDLMKSFSFFEVESGYADKLIGALNNAKFLNKKVAVEIAQERNAMPGKGKYPDDRKRMFIEKRKERRNKEKKHKYGSR